MKISDCFGAKKVLSVYLQKDFFVYFLANRYDFSANKFWSENACWCHRLNMEFDLQLIWILCTAVLISETPQHPLPSHLDSNTRALLVSQDRRHLFVTPWLVYLKVHKNENFFGFDFEFCTISLLVMSKY